MRYKKRTLTVGVIGLGCVGSAIAKGLNAEKNGVYALTKICALHKKPWLKLSKGVTFHKNYLDILSDPHIDIVVEAVGGVSLANDIVSRALINGKHVVTTNAALMAVHGKMLMTTARVNNRQLRFGGAMCGAVNWQALLPEDVSEITFTPTLLANRILVRMEQDALSLEEALEAEKVDISTVHSQMKVSVYRLALARFSAFGVWSDMVRNQPQSIEYLTQNDIRLARKMGYMVRVVGVADAHSMVFSPKLMPATHTFLEEEQIQCQTSCGLVSLTIPAYGAESAAFGAVRDVQNIVQERRMPIGAQLYEKAHLQEEERYFVRLPAALKAAMPTDARLEIVAQTSDKLGENTAFMVRSKLSRQGVLELLKCEEALVMPVAIKEDKQLFA